jgi:hypothetical protein
VAVQREPKARHARREERRLWALHDPELNAYLGWPHLQQICRVERRRSLVRRGQAVRTEHAVTYLITSAGPERADAPLLLRTNRGHWGIENRTPHVRDVTFDEDRSQVRSGAAPQAFAACKNLALALLRRRGPPTSPKRSAPTPAARRLPSLSSPQAASTDEKALCSGR